MVPAKAPKIESAWEANPRGPYSNGCSSSSGSHLFSPLLPTGLTLAGARVSPLAALGDPLTHPKTSFQDGDVIIVSYPESGANFVLEILPWLLHQDVTSSDITNNLERKVLEHLNNAQIQTGITPRIFLTHVWPAHFPAEVTNKNVKFIHVVRNPKDVAASLFHRLRQDGVFSFQNFLDLYISNQVGTGHQFSYLQQIKEFVENHQKHSHLDIHFEDLIKKPVEVIHALGDFLDMPVSGSLCDHILSSNCFLQTLGQTGQSDHSVDGEHRHCPGTIGHWKNTFTMAQSETFNFFIFQMLRQTAIINFTYS